MHHAKCWMGWITTWNQDCHLSLGRKARTNLNSVLKCKDNKKKLKYITLLTKVHIVKAMFFPVGMYAYDSGTKKKSESWRIDVFELWWWRRLLKVSWTAERSNQSIIKEINPEYSLEELILKLKLWLWPLYVKSWFIGKDTDARDLSQKEKRMAEDEMVRIHHWFNGHEFEETLGDSEGWKSLTFCSPWGCKESNMTWWLNTTHLLIQFSSVAQLCPAVSPWTAALQGSLSITTPRPCSNSCPSSPWCHPTILSSVTPLYPPTFNLWQHQIIFKWVSSSHQVAKVLEFQLQHQSFQWIFRTDFL